MIPVTLAYGIHGRWRLSETERLWAGYGLIILLLLLTIWGLTVLVRYYFREQMIRRKMRWSATIDPFWNYDAIIDKAKNLYTRAQLLLNTNSPAFLKKLSPYARARMRLFRKQVRAAQDLRFGEAYIVCFDDKKNNAADSVAVYLRLHVRGIGSFEEVVVMHRYENDWKITDYIRNPTVFMITHARSIVEKS